MGRLEGRPASAGGPVVTAGAASASSSMETLDVSIQRAIDHLIGLQDQSGFWWAELEANCSIHAEYLLLTHFMGVPNPDRWEKTVNYLKNEQLPDGGWPIWHGGPGDLNIAVEAYFAMKLAGVPPEDPALVRAREFILSQGGVANTRVFTKMWLALFGQWDWRGTPALPAELVLLPTWSPFNIYEFASWARATVVACTSLMTIKPTCPVPEFARIDELYLEGRDNTKYSYGKTGKPLSWNGVFRLVDQGLKFGDKAPIKPFRKRALQVAAEWLLQRQEADGSWGGIQPPWVYSLMALKAMGYPLDHPAIKRGLEGFESFARETEDTFRTDPCVSPVWDTCLAMLALQDAGVPNSHPSLEGAARWLLDKQVLEHRGDWRVKRPDLLPGGWPFEFHNNNYPDIDDSAMVLIALDKMGWRDDERMQLALDRGVQWIAGMQSKNGGWGSFDADNDRWFVSHIPFCDFGAVMDPPTEDVTGHVVEMLGRLEHNGDPEVIARGLEYLRATQEPDGSWWGRWGVNHIYGLGAVLPALRWAGEYLGQPYIRKAVDWLKERQNTDGGWGEGCESYTDPDLRGRGPSTASQTGWALLALIAAGEAHSRSAGDGVEYLLKTQQPDGSWEESSFTGTGFPADFMIKYHLYRNYWPLMALGQYRQATRGHD